MTNKDTASVLRELVEAARPFTRGDVVDETSGTIPLMERLGNAIYDADALVLQTAPEAPCLHDDTYRAGAIWEICNQCGMMWADDEGGRPKSPVAAPEAPSREAAPQIKTWQERATELSEYPSPEEAYNLLQAEIDELRAALAQPEAKQREQMTAAYIAALAQQGAGAAQRMRTMAANVEAAWAAYCAGEKRPVEEAFIFEAGYRAALANKCTLTDAELADPEFVKAYIEGCNETFNTMMTELKRARAALAQSEAKGHVAFKIAAMWQARTNKFIDWYLRGGNRHEVHEHGHIVQTTREHIWEWLDAALANKTGDSHE